MIRGHGSSTKANASKRHKAAIGGHGPEVGGGERQNSAKSRRFEVELEDSLEPFYPAFQGARATITFLRTDYKFRNKQAKAAGLDR